MTAGVPLPILPVAGTPSTGTALTLTDLQAVPSNTAEVTAGAFGSASWSGADLASPFEVWITGHRMSSWVYRKPIGSDPHLVAWLEVRLYAGAIVEVLPWVENGMLMVSGPTSKSATYTFTLGGVLRFSAAIDIPHHCRAPLVSGTALSHWLGATDPDVIVKHDGAGLQKSGLVASYFAVTPESAAVVTGLPTTFTPLQRGSFPAGLGGVGGNAYVGMLPEWDVAHLTSSALSTYKAVVFNAYSVGRYGIHYRDESNGHRPPRLSLRPSLNLAEPSSGWETTPATSGTASDAWSVDHQPNAGILAYLITGRRYHLDTVQMIAANNAMGGLSSTNRENGLGLFKSQFAGSARGAAWTWRMLAQAAAITPDAGDPLKGEFRTQLQNNITWYHARYIGSSNDPYNPRGNRQGFIQQSPGGSPYQANLNGAITGATSTTITQADGVAPGYANARDGHFVGWTLVCNGQTRTCTGYTHPVGGIQTYTVSPAWDTTPTAGMSVVAYDGKHWCASWMDDYITGVWGQLFDMGCGLDATFTARMTELYTWKAQAIVGRLGFTGATEYLYRNFAPYTLPFAPVEVPDWDGGTGPWWDDWGQIYAATYAGTVPDGTALPYPYSTG
ncbi:MAG: hypothetical protein Q8R98_03285, partial [Rubrivivax sp.]|nr:hypothetical protein [Rubrivivax sp.]